MNPPPLGPAIDQYCKSRGTNTLFHPIGLGLRTSTAPEDIPEEAPIQRIIFFSEINLPYETGSVRPSPSSYDLLCDDNTICHLPTRDKSRLEGADEGPEQLSESVGKHLRNDQVNALRQRDGPEVAHPLVPGSLRQQCNVSPVDAIHPTSTSIKLFHKCHDVRPHLGPTVFVEENRDPIGPRCLFCIQTTDCCPHFVLEEGARKLLLLIWRERGCQAPVHRQELGGPRRKKERK